VVLGWVRLIAATVTALLVLLAAPLAALPVVPVVEVVAGKDAPPLARAIRYTKEIDPVGTPINQILALPLHARAADVEHFGPPGSRTALALRIRNAGEDAGTWILTTGRGSLSHFRLYELTGTRFQLLLDGSDPAVAQANLRTYQAFSREVTLNPGQTKTLVIDFQSDNSTYMPLRLETYGTFFRDRRANVALVSGVVLAIAVLVFVNSMFFSITGHREFGWLALAQTFFAIATVHTEGYLTIFILADSPLLSVAIEDGVKCAFTLSMAQFARSFLKTPERFPRLDKALFALVIAASIVIALQFGLSLYSPAFRGALHAIAWIVTGSTALFLPVVGFLAIRHVGRQLWPLLVGWGSLAFFIVYGAIASMGVFEWLPINWHSIGPVGLFEVLMVTLALGLNLRTIQTDREEANARYTQSMAERLRITESAARLAEEREFALTAVDNQNALLHASGHDSKQVILALNSAINVLKRSNVQGVPADLAQMLQSSVDYLGEIAATTMSGATIVGRRTGFVALSAFKGQALIEPLLMMFRGPFANKGLILDGAYDHTATLISDRPLLMRALANLVSNSLQYSLSGGVRLALRIEGNSAVIEISDTGPGISEDVVRQLVHDDAPRTKIANGAGTGSGFRSARQIIESLGGSLRIVSSDASGTQLEVRLCCALQQVTPCTLDELSEHLGGWQLFDCDRRAEREPALAGYGGWSSGDSGAETAQRIAATHDDTSVTRGRLAETAALMLIKPLYIEMALHPTLRQASDQL
jgi:two-component system, sensor histidine kinase LadS